MSFILFQVLYFYVFCEIRCQPNLQELISMVVNKMEIK